MAIMAAAFVLRSIFYYIITFLGHRFGIYVEADIREGPVSAFQAWIFEFFDKTVQEN